MLEGFDFSAVDQPSFKEDAVREEIITPLLHSLGYKATGDLRIERSKKLIHPFVMIGSKKHKINIIPDYTIYEKDKPLLVLEAKAPDEPIVKSAAVEQAYSYAIHAEVRCDHYALCNGKQLVLFEVKRFDPVFVIDCKDIPSRVDDVKRHFDSRTLNLPEIREFKPDFGIAAKKLGVTQDGSLLCKGLLVQMINKANDLYFTSIVTCENAQGEFMLSLDYGKDPYQWILDSLPLNQADQIRIAMRTAPYQIIIDCKISIDCEAKLGELVQGPYEDFIPWIMTAFDGSRYIPENTTGFDDPEAVRLRIPKLQV